MKNTILLLEDEPVLREGICYKLRKEGCRVLPCSGVVEGLALFEREQVDLVICDIALPDGNGLDFCRKLRQKSDVRFLFLTARDSEMDIVMGYEAGADDYMTKPFSLSVLLSKVHAILKRLSGNGNTETAVSGGERLCSGGLSMDPSGMKVYRDGEEILLSKKELQLLHFFLRHSGQILSREQLLEAVWDMDGEFVDENTAAVTIRRLREKIEENASAPVLLKTVRGLGYRWEWPVKTVTEAGGFGGKETEGK